MIFADFHQVECPLIFGTPYTLNGALDKESEQCRFITEARREILLTRLPQIQWPVLLHVVTDAVV